ncbi:hypothetical protein [Lysinibacillus piscis]|uniref:Uncharacterized protein n=1 Tax=Lysinibacillus piscis TaxID=2518931 RepID=A0ABQ5NQK1_9BACI|nr:hypothetical protein [Lysinibacillus sp. KH24]GLC90515.1 hypothetical protein LYSBPC_36420 [Lysinibacillus sp. KH24]
MDDKQFNQQMELLKKTYDRLEPQLNPDAVLAQIEEQEKLEKIVQPPSRRQKPTVWLTAIASLFVIGLLTATYVIAQPEERNSAKELSVDVTDQKWIETITKKYNSKKDQIKRELKVSSETLQSFAFIQKADRLLEYYISAAKQKGTEPYFFENAEKAILSELMTPRRAFEMIGNRKSLTFEESFEVYRLYEKSAKELELYYNQALEPYQMQIRKTTDKSQYPAKLQELLKAANKQFMVLQVDANGESYFVSNILGGELSPKSLTELDPAVFGYFEYLQKGYLLLGDDLRYTKEETMLSLNYIQYTLTGTPHTKLLEYEVLQQTFVNTWLAILKGTTKYPAVDKDGTMREDYIQFLKEMVSGEYSSVMQATAKDILVELQESNHSKTFTNLTSTDIMSSIYQRRERLKVLLDESNYVFTDILETDREQIQQIYQQYQKNGETVINQLHPVNLVQLYVYALERGDKTLQAILLLPDANMGELSKLNRLSYFSQIGEYTGDVQPTVVLRVDNEHQASKKEFRIRLARNNNGYYRIEAILD